jgi:hypothetical protein
MKSKRLKSRLTSFNLGRATLKAYCDLRGLDRIERKEDYTVTDLVTDVLQFAMRKGIDVEAIIASAQNHIWAETVESCPKCGNRTTRQWASIDYGSGAEEGRTFYYCSDECKETH